MLQILNPLLSLQQINLWKKCVVCGMIFMKKYHVSPSQWSRQVSCSKRCQIIRRRNSEKVPSRITGVYRCYGKFTYTCCLCKEEIRGSKRDLKQHKYEKHGH